MLDYFRKLMLPTFTKKCFLIFFEKDFIQIPTSLPLDPDRFLFEIIVIATGNDSELYVFRYICDFKKDFQKWVKRLCERYHYVLIHNVQTNVNYLPLKYPQNRYNEAWVDRMLAKRFCERHHVRLIIAANFVTIKLKGRKKCNEVMCRQFIY